MASLTRLRRANADGVFRGHHDLLQQLGLSIRQLLVLQQVDVLLEVLGHVLTDWLLPICKRHSIIYLLLQLGPHGVYTLGTLQRLQLVLVHGLAFLRDRVGDSLESVLVVCEFLLRLEAVLEVGEDVRNSEALLLEGLLLLLELG